MKYRHLFFDLDNTIWDFDKNSYNALKNVLTNLGILEESGNYDTLYKTFSEVNENYRKLYRERKIDKQTFQEGRFEIALNENGTPFPEFSPIINNKYINEISNMKLLKEGAVETLDYLYNKYNLFIITNGFIKSQNNKLEKSGISHYFKKVYISEEVGASKPDRKIFEYAIKSSNARKNESVMIGDTWETDIVGAMKFGIDQIYLPQREVISSPNTPSFLSTFPQISGIFQNLSPKTLNIIPLNNTKSTTFAINSLSSLIDIF